MNYFVYVIFNNFNGKLYIGKTKDMKRRFKEHTNAAKNEKYKYPIHRAIEKYGLGWFSFRILQEFSNETESLEAEKYWISYFNSNNPSFGYNASTGGENPIFSEETKQKMRKPKTIKRSKESIEKISGENNITSKFKLWQIREIRENKDKNSVSELARIYNIHPSTISSIIHNINWHDDNYVVPDIKDRKNGRKNTKLTLKKANEIRKLHSAGNTSMRKLAKKYDCTHKIISEIINNKIWKN